MIFLFSIKKLLNLNTMFTKNIFNTTIYNKKKGTDKSPDKIRKRDYYAASANSKAVSKAVRLRAWFAPNHAECIRLSALRPWM